MTRIVAEVKHVEVKANKNSGAYFYYYISNHHSTPEGLTKEARILAGIYLASIIGLVSKPYPEPVIMLSAVGLSCLTVARFDDSPSGQWMY